MQYSPRWWRLLAATSVGRPPPPPLLLFACPLDHSLLSLLLFKVRSLRSVRFPFSMGLETGLCCFPFLPSAVPRLPGQRSLLFDQVLILPFHQRTCKHARFTLGAVRPCPGSSTSFFFSLRADYIIKIRRIFPLTVRKRPHSLIRIVDRKPLCPFSSRPAFRFFLVGTQSRWKAFCASVVRPRAFLPSQSVSPLRPLLFGILSGLSKSHRSSLSDA